MGALGRSLWASTVLATLMLGCENTAQPPASAPASTTVPTAESSKTVLEELFGVESAAPAVADAKDPRDVVARSLHSVLLVWNQRADGQIGFGSALLLSGNLALTNVHVIENAKALSVMFYDSARINHGGIAGEGGGLRRYVFENEKALVPAELVRDDPALDLAVIRIKGDTSSYPRLRWRTEPARIGEPVFAVGHPAENAWSFTTGVVANAHVKSIQVDAAINVGNSGGPLLDRQGQVIGINTLRALGDTQGIGYARPIALARGVIDGVSQATMPDLSSPEKARVSCAQAAELASDGWVECEDFEAALAFTDLTEARALSELGNPPALVEALKKGHVSREERTRQLKEGRIQWMRRNERTSKVSGGVSQSLPENPFRKMPAAEIRVIQGKLEQAKGRLDAFHATSFGALEKRTGLKKKDGSPFVPVEGDTLRMGQRADHVAKADPTHAWVAITGLNADGSRYQFSQLWVERQGKWREVRIPPPVDAGTLPRGFPPPPFDYEAVLAHQTDHVLVAWRPWVAKALRD
jgi:S1-C subfamily serine protease